MNQKEDFHKWKADCSRHFCFESRELLKSRLLEKTRKTKGGLMLDLSHLNISTLDLSQKQVRGQDRPRLKTLFMFTMHFSSLIFPRLTKGPKNTPQARCCCVFSALLSNSAASSPPHPPPPPGSTGCGVCSPKMFSCGCLVGVCERTKTVHCSLYQG